MDRAEVIIHPTRLKMIQLFGGERRLTAQQVAALLPDIPRASLYRHLNLLVEAGVLAVVEERPARAVQERVYALVARAANVGPAEYTATSAEDHLRYFTAFLELLHDDFAQYLRHDPSADVRTDGVAYYQMPLYLSAEEYQQLVVTLKAVLAPLLTNLPAPARRRRLLSIIAMPAAEAATASSTGALDGDSVSADARQRGADGQGKTR